MIKNKLTKRILIISIVLVCAFLVWFLIIQKMYLFHQSQNKLEQAGKDYFERNSTYLPKNIGDVKTVYMSALYKEKYLAAQYVPNKKELCDSESSWVKVRREKEGLRYYTYLKCGKRESNIDHEGPQIVLNGDKNIKIDKGTEYKELGIKKIEDKKEGILENGSVKIRSKVDSSKIGTYVVTYTANDSLDNKTVVERKVQVVDMLYTVVKKETDQKGYYVGTPSKNYVLFSGMLWQIIGVNDDNTVKLITNQTISNMNYNSKDGTFENSEIKNWLNDYFYNHLSKKAKTYLVAKTWCNDAIENGLENFNKCTNKTKKHKVGLLSVSEFNRSIENENTYLNSLYMHWLLNAKDKNQAWVNRYDFIYSDNSDFVAFDDDTLLGVRPVIVLKKDVPIIGGTGTKDNPYLLEDYSPGKKRTKLNTRISGEYINYSGMLWRIVDSNSDGTTKVVMSETIRVNGNEVLIGYDIEDKAKIYNSTQKGNVGYQIENNMNKYVNTKLFVNHEIQVPIYKNKANYSSFDTKKYKVKLSAPNAYEMFSAKTANSDFSSYWLINSSKEQNRLYIMANAGSIYTQEVNDQIKAGVKLVAYFDKDVVIKEGNGQIDNPYYVEKG